MIFTAQRMWTIERVFPCQLSRSGDRRLNNVGVGPYHIIFLIRGQRLPGLISWKENLYFQSSVLKLNLQEHNSKHLMYNSQYHFKRCSNENMEDGGKWTPKDRKTKIEVELCKYEKT